MRNSSFVEEFRKLSTEDKLELLRALWGELEAEAETRPLTEEERHFLDDRLRELEEDPRPDRSWADVRNELTDGR